MREYHSNPGINQLLNLLESGTRSLVDGLPIGALTIRWKIMGLEPELLGQALDKAAGQGLIRSDADRASLTVDGYRMLTRESVADVPQLAERNQFGQNLRNEYQLRMALCEMLRDPRVRSGGRISAPLLSELWQVARWRTSDLRLAIDIFIRHGHLRLGRFRQTVFQLEKDGEAYLSGRAAPDAIVQFAPSAGQDSVPGTVLPDASLLAMAVYQFRGERADSGMSVNELMFLLEKQFRLSPAMAFHACELGHRLGLLDWHEKQAELVLAPGGAELRDRVDAGDIPRSISQDLASQAAPDA